MSGDRGACGVCQADLTPENSSKLRSGKVVHIGCPGAVTENRFSVTSAAPTKTEVPASVPGEIAPTAPPRKGRRMSIGGPVGCSEEVRQAVAADPALRVKVEAVGLAGQLLPKPVAGQRVPDAAEDARVRAESAARMREPGLRAEADRRGLSAPPRLVIQPPKGGVGGAAVKVHDVAPGVAVMREVNRSAQDGRVEAQAECDRVNVLNDDTASAGPDDFELPEQCSVCGKPKSKRLGLVLSTGTHLRCKPAQVRAQARGEVEELETDKAGLKEDVTVLEAEVEDRDDQIEALTSHPEIGDLARAVIDDLPSPESRFRRSDEQAALLKEPPPRHHFGGAPDGGVLDVSPPREPGELIHLFGLQEFGAYPFGKDRPGTIVALCGRETAAQTRDLELTVARLDEPKAGGVTSLSTRNCPDCVRKWSPERQVFPAYVKPSQMQDLRSVTPQVEEPSPVTRSGGRARSPRAGR